MFPSHIVGQNLATFLDLVENVPKRVPTSVPNHFQTRVAHRKMLWNSGVKHSNGATVGMFEKG